MRKTNKLIAAVLSVATMISVASCGGGGGRSNNNNAGGSDATDAEGNAVSTSAPATAAQIETYETDAALQDAVSSVQSDVLASLNPTRQLTFLSNWAADNTGAAAELYRASFGIDAETEVVHTEVISYNDLYSRLAVLIQSGDSPDLFPFEKEYFPIQYYKGMFQPINDIIDMSGPEWDGWRDITEQFKWAGNSYVPVCEFYPQAVFWYRHSVIEEAGFDDPYELFLEGKWDWDTFLDMASRFKQTGEGKYICDGWYAQTLIFASTGVPLVGLGDDGKLVNNLFDPNVERAADLISTLCNQEYRFPLVENGWSPLEKAWVNGDTLFFDDGMWFYQGNGHKYAEKFMDYNYDDIFFVPCPKDPKADEYYHEYKVFGFVLPAGSDKYDEYKAWIECNMLVLQDETVKAAARDKLMKDEKWTETQLAFREQLYSPTETPLVPVYDFRTGINTDAADTTSGSTIIDLIVKTPYNDSTATFQDARATYSGIIDSAINDINSTVE